MPDGISDENEGNNEETLEGESSWSMVGFEETAVDRFEEQLEIWHLCFCIPSARAHDIWGFVSGLQVVIILCGRITDRAEGLFYVIIL
jgi:hypothetical protein